MFINGVESLLLFSFFWALINFIIIFLIMWLKLDKDYKENASFYFYYCLIELVPFLNVISSCLIIIIIICCLISNLSHNFDKVLGSIYNRKNIFLKNKKISDTKKLKLLEKYLIDTNVFKNKKDIHDAIFCEEVTNKLIENNNDVNDWTND